MSTMLICCDNDSDKEKSLRNVIIYQTTSNSDMKVAEYPGVIEEGASIGAAFMADGKIEKIYVKEGDRVRKGQLLAALDDTDYKIGVSQLETQYDQMTKEKERMDAMYEKRNIAPNDYEKFSAGYKQLQLQLDMAKRQLDYTKLYSPVDGYISEKYLNPGELVGAGTPVFNIIDDHTLIAATDLPVSVYLNRDNIKEIYGAVPSIGTNFPLKELSFTPDGDNNMMYRMKLTIPSSFSKELTPGMNITVGIEVKEMDNKGELIPSRAIFSENGNSYVWIFNPEDSIINKTEVMIVGTPSGEMSVVTGLKNKDMIVETGVKQLYEGEKVNVLKRKELGI